MLPKNVTVIVSMKPKTTSVDWVSVTMKSAFVALGLVVDGIEVAFVKLAIALRPQITPRIKFEVPNVSSFEVLSINVTLKVTR